MTVSRRKFFALAGAGAASVTAYAPLEAFYSRIANGEPVASFGFGPLVPQLPVNAAELKSTVVGNLSQEPILALPRGFNYRVISVTGELMSDGTTVPAGHDGMAAFPGSRRTTVLVRNHELSTSLQTPFNFTVSGFPRYSTGALGGTTTLVIDRNRNLERHFVSLAGTTTNCAGGATPWGSWISCEETFSSTNSTNGSVAHGYNFEVVANENSGIVFPSPIRAMGRFSHEAVAVDPATGFIYETEDRVDSCFYRFVPESRITAPGQLASMGGQLFALKIRNNSPTSVNTTNNPFQGGTPGLIKVGDSLPVEWVEIDNADPVAENRTGNVAAGEVGVRYQAQSKGAAIFFRGEGCWYGNGLIYFVATQAGPPASANLPSPPGNGRGNGQVWAYDPRKQTLTLIVEASSSGDLLDEPDNVTVTPFGDLFLCEDSSDNFQYIVGVTSEGQAYQFAKNILFSQVTNDPAKDPFIGNEFAGACFSPDGRTLFVNIQTPGITFAIWGPWNRIRRSRFVGGLR